MNLYLKSGLPYANIDGRTTEIAKIFKACSKRLTDIEKEGTFSLTPQCDLLWHGRDRTTKWNCRYFAEFLFKRLTQTSITVVLFFSLLAAIPADLWHTFILQDGGAHEWYAGGAVRQPLYAAGDGRNWPRGDEGKPSPASGAVGGGGSQDRVADREGTGTDCAGAVIWQLYLRSGRISFTKTERDMVCCLPSEWCTATSFYQISASHVSFYPFLICEIHCTLSSIMLRNGLMNFPIHLFSLEIKNRTCFFIFQ